MYIKILKKNPNLILEEIKKKTPVIVYRKFLNSNDCKKIINICHKNNDYKNHRKLKVNKYFNFHSIDVLPSNVSSNRIFRTFELSNFFIKKFKSIRYALSFQDKIIKKDNKKIYRRVQVIHYPVGGGFFEEHTHPRYPTNYGMIVTLSRKNKDFKEGVTTFRVRNKNIELEKYQITVGDLILFKFDLPHSITKCDPKKDLKFDLKGRWTLIFPTMYQKKFKQIARTREY